METLSFLSSQETWLRLHQGEPDAWKTPTWNGRPRIQKPPLLVWLNLLAWHGLSPKTATVEDLAARARRLAAGLSLIGVAAVFAIGLVLGGADLALIASLATGLSAGFIRQGRYASYDTHLMAWVALAVAGAVWACRTENGQALRRPAGWAVAGLGLLTAIYTKGPLAFALVVPAWTAAAWLLSSNRARDFAALIAVSIFNVAALGFWFLIARRAAPNAPELLREEYAYIFEISKNPFFYAIVVPLLFPWSLWLAAGLFMPAWRRSAIPSRREAWFLWTWFAAVSILLSLSPVKNKRYLAPLFPAAGALAASAALLRSTADALSL